MVPRRSDWRTRRSVLHHAALGSSEFERVAKGGQSYTPARSMTETDLLVIGDCNPDLVLGPEVTPVYGQAEQVIDEASLTIGGSGAIVACGAARLGLRTSIAALVGEDAFGRIQLDALRERSVGVEQVVADPAQRTGLSVILRRGDDRAILTLLGAVAEFRIDHLDRSAIAAARHVHISSYFLQRSLRPDVEEVLALAHEGGATTSLDTNWDPDEDWTSGLSGVLAELDCFLPNAEEARRISGCVTNESALSALAAVVPTVAIKLGSDGAIARNGDQVVRQGAFACEVVDSVGAGDSFNAGFLTGLHRRWTLEESLALACACGSLSTRAAGGVAAQPSIEEATEVAGIAVA